MRILDVGGFSGFWLSSGVQSQITILRPEAPEPLGPDCPANITSIQGDGCNLTGHGDGSFDLVFSNSVIEHVGNWERQKAFAREALRVGRRVWIQTPAFEFPMEPHVLTPFFHWLPGKWREKLYPLTAWAIFQRPKPTIADYHLHVCAELLSRRNMSELFPGAQIITERFLLLPKSYVAWTGGN
jgi:hypothetical protein